MKYPHQVKLLVKAFDVIGRVDPKLLDSMRASRWEVRPVYSLDDALAQVTSPSDKEDVAKDFADAFGFTGARRAGSGSTIPGITLLNLPYIRKVAEGEGMPLDQMLALVLAHEYQHYADKGEGGEMSAFKETARFGCLPGISATVCKFAENSAAMAILNTLFTGYAYR